MAEQFAAGLSFISGVDASGAADFHFEKRQGPAIRLLFGKVFQEPLHEMKKFRTGMLRFRR